MNRLRTIQRICAAALVALLAGGCAATPAPSAPPAARQSLTLTYAFPDDATSSAAAGATNPAPGWTWSDWLADAKKLTVATGGQVSRYGTALAPWGAMVWGNGGELISADGKRSLLDSPEAAAGVQFAADMVTVHH